MGAPKQQLLAAVISQGLPTFSIRPGRIPPGGTFSRGTSATQVNADGSLTLVPAGVLRTADYSDDPLRRGIKIEPQATNLVPFSDSAQGAGWTMRPGTVVQASTIPAPNQSVYFNFDKGASTDGYVYRTDWFPVAGQSYTISLYARGGGVIDLNAWTGTIAYKSQNFQCDGVWRRYSLTFTAETVGTGRDYGFHVSVGSVDIFGVQLETGPVATSYIPTAGAAVTRGADVWNYPLSSVPGWNMGSGTLVVWNKLPLSFAGWNTPFTLGAGSSSLAILTSTPATRQAWAGSFQGQAGAGADGKSAVSFSPNGGPMTIALSGALSAGALPAGSVADPRLVVGEWAYSNGAKTSQTIYALDYYPAALPAARLQALTAP